ncbi:MAG TPA: hypothetical protein VGX25_11270 [Actinophytocola sp.]|uniref:hypothetical protein n=1 Tax=Actinophytocola sp. TaxID=1872138 RepID=UPI002DDDABBE|nr:hypothetical protein [Actinophytocola sp.]HEV2779966.1 hypothetical protein [Actinophytocola sp.]
MQGPAVTDWMSALGEIAGAAGTVAAVAVALLLARRGARRQRIEQADREAGQARLIIAELHRAEGRWWVRTTNHSTAPVFQVEILEVRHPDGVSTVEPAPGAPVELTKLPAGEVNDRALALGGDPATAVVVLRFLDAAGLRWHRAGTGQPQRVLDG